MPVKKIVYGSTTLLDLTHDTVTASHLESGYTAHDANGEAIVGTLNISGSSNPQIKNVIPYTTSQVITPDDGYDCLAKVNVAAISYTTEDNYAGGTTVRIGEVAS